MDRGGGSVEEVRLYAAMRRPVTITVAATPPGSVVPAPQGIDCGSPCSARFEVGSVVKLSALPLHEAAVSTTWPQAPARRPARATP